MPVAKALAVFLNSTAGRLQLMRHPGKTIDFPAYAADTAARIRPWHHLEKTTAFPAYAADTAARIRVPDISDPQILEPLTECWEHTRYMQVPQYREGECEVRRLWDKAVCLAVGWDFDQLTEWRHLLHLEPHVRQLGYSQYDDDPDDALSD
ncbi:MAG: hypothetical protein KTV68_16950 [Acidimicrobiia bacterium]|nr:hypothetical protein [Acidimicrobiia bacterium]